MEPKYTIGQKVFLVESNHFIKEVTVKSFASGFYIVQFFSGGGIRVKESRLFASEDEAKNSIRKDPATRRGYWE